MTDTDHSSIQQIYEIYKSNPFVMLLQMSIEHLGEGEAVLQMPVVDGIHTNLFGVAHGGALASLADTAMGVACAAAGKRVVTIDMNINYLHGAQPGETVRARGVVLHNGRATMVAEAAVETAAGELVAKARGTFFVIGGLSASGD